MRRVLFVDDEPRVLEGLERMLHRQRDAWDMHFANGGEAALAALRANPFDVLVTDMRMPGMDGAALLAAAKDEFPAVVRIVLSGHTEMAAALRAVPVAHQFLSKPCNAVALQDAVERACSLNELLGESDLAHTIGEMGTLPSLPHVYAALTKALGDPDSSLVAVAEIVRKDSAICAKLLQLANSGFFGSARRIADIQQAVTVLGTATIRNLTLSVEVFRTFGSMEAVPGFSPQALQNHALLTAAIATRLLPGRQDAEDAFSAAMLHDVGQLVLAAAAPARLAAPLAAARARGIPLHVAEHEQFGVTHAEIGAYLLGLWGLPYPIVEAVAFHHHPERVPHDRFDVLSAVHIADILAEEQEAGAAEHETSLLDASALVLESQGIVADLSGWRAIAVEQAAAVH